MNAATTTRNATPAEFDPVTMARVCADKAAAYEATGKKAMARIYCSFAAGWRREAKKAG